MDLPIIRRAGLPAAFEEVAGEASFDGGFSAITEALLQITSGWQAGSGSKKVLGAAVRLLGRSS